MMYTEYVPRKEGGRGLTSIQDSVNASIQLENYIKKRSEKPFTATRNNSDNSWVERYDIF